MKTDHKVLIEGRYRELLAAAANVRIPIITRNDYERVLSRCEVIAERAEILDKLLKESSDQDWQK